MGERKTLRLVAQYGDACNLFDIPDGGKTIRRKLDVLARHCSELTPAERRIAELVAEGMPNREIGQALFMSVGTVEAHLTRIYRKLGIRSRPSWRG